MMAWLLWWLFPISSYHLELQEKKDHQLLDSEANGFLVFPVLVGVCYVAIKLQGARADRGFRASSSLRFADTPHE